MAQLKETTIDGKLTILNNNLYLDNGNSIFGLNSNGENRSLVQMNVSNQSVFGYGGYSNNEGASYFDGNNVNIRSKNGIYITSPNAGLNAREYGINKVLWSGGYYMTEGHTINLSESVLAQPTGIVLVWSAYADGGVQNWGFTTTFIPKHLVQTHGSGAGAGVDCPLIRQAMSRIGCKYLYIAPTQIKGHARNSEAATVNGVTYNNAYWVLRYVIGV